MEVKEILSKCDHTLLAQTATWKEIRAICAATAAEVECFVHGAVCVGYSGRCFLSRSMSAAAIAGRAASPAA